jgi:shikimate dehydrogenase
MTTASPSQVRSGPDKTLFGLIGSGIGRSLTPSLHEAEGAHLGMRVHYQIIDLDRGRGGASQLPMLFESARVMGFAGLNITFPCKQQVIELLDDLSDDARALGAVNTVVFDKAGRATGFNTDCFGWRESFRRKQPQADLSRVVLLGAGGAGSAVAHAVMQLGAEQLSIVDIDVQRAEQLAQRVGRIHGQARVKCTTLEDAMRDASGLIHATPTGMDKLPGLPLSSSLLRSSMWVSDIVYFPLETELLRIAQALGCVTVDGGGMAVWQAVGAFAYFTGVTPDADRMEAHVRRLVATPARAG